MDPIWLQSKSEISSKFKLVCVKGNGITLNDAMANYRQNNINRSLTPEVEYLMRMQAQAQYMGAQRYHFPQMGGRYPNMYQNLAPAQPMGYQSSRYYTQQQHTPPNAVELRFMRDRKLNLNCSLVPNKSLDRVFRMSKNNE